ATRMSLVLGAEIAGYALLGIPSGTVLGRLGSKRTMLAADALRAPLVLAVPALHWSGSLSLGVLIILAFALGVLSAPYGAAPRLDGELLGRRRCVAGDLRRDPGARDRAVRRRRPRRRLVVRCVRCRRRDRQRSGVVVDAADIRSYARHASDHVPGASALGTRI